MKQAIRLRQGPLSPHLQIYRRQMTMVMSILHRINGAALYLDTLLLAWGLVATAWSESAYAAFESFVGSPFGKIVLFGYTWARAHHLMGVFVILFGHGQGV
ncbi:MAG: succinate dehydrogenase, cytochrome b556 subunit [Sneathiella sp.]|nr:succinate dehydrogenase, cytochrome b556 subunit [Sneathiella sp.]